MRPRKLEDLNCYALKKNTSLAAMHDESKESDGVLLWKLRTITIQLWCLQQCRLQGDSLKVLCISEKDRERARWKHFSIHNEISNDPLWDKISVIDRHLERLLELRKPF